MFPTPRPAFALLVLLPAVASAQAPAEDARIRSFEAFVHEKMESLQITGLSVAVAQDDFRWSGGFGHADVENRTPARADSSYRMASVTKPMTAVGVLRLVELGKVELDAEVQRYVPDFPRKPQPVTVRQLLSHLGGISHYRNYDVEGRLKDPRTTHEAIAIFKDFDLVAEPGTRYNYSSYGYNLLGAVIEGASGRSYGDFMRAEVWGPLGMDDTRLDSPRDLIPRRVRGYERQGGVLRNSEYVDISSRFAGGGTRSTVLDMLKLVHGLDAGRVLRRETLESMWTEAATRDGAGVHYGFGWGVEGVDGRFEVAHGGAQQETRTYLLYVPRHHFAAAVATNLENARPSIFADRLAALFLGGTRSLPFDAPAAADRSALDAVRGVFDEGLAHYDRAGAPLTLEPAKLAAAFRYLDEAVREAAPAGGADAPSLRARGRDPATGRPWAVAGSYMAHVLAGGDRARLGTYQREGPLRLFSDYAKRSRVRGGVLREARLPASLDVRLERWSADWARVWDADAALAVLDAADLARLEAARARWAGATVRPGYEADLVRLAEDGAEQGDPAIARRAAQIAGELYPGSEAVAAVVKKVTGATSGSAAPR